MMKICHRVSLMKGIPNMNNMGQLVGECLSVLEPPERLTVSEASEKYRFVNNPGSYVGQWKNDTVPYMVEPMDVLRSRDYQACIFVGAAQTGKGLPLDTSIRCPSGWTTMGNLNVGDVIFDECGDETTVVFTSEIHNGLPCYEVVFDDGTSLITDNVHKWNVADLRNKRGKVLTLNTEEIYNTHRTKTNTVKGWRSRYAIPMNKPLMLSESKLQLDPYTLGVWLGDGHVWSGAITLNNVDLSHIVNKLPYKTKVNDDNGVTTFRVVVDGIKSTLKTMGLLKNNDNRDLHARFIPTDYMNSSIEQRTALIRGLMDTDGTVDEKGGYEFSTSHKALADNVRTTLWSLGIKSTLRAKKPKFKYKGVRKEGLINYTVCFKSDEVVFFTLPRQVKKLKDRTPNKTRPSQWKRRFIVDVKPVDSVLTKCIQVDSPNSLFLAGNQMVATHNTDSLIVNPIVHSVTCDPMDMIVYQTSQGIARDFSKRRIDRLHKHSVEVGNRLRTGSKYDNTHDKHYKNGMMLTLSWPTINELSGRPVGFVLLTDYDRMELDIDGEGSPFDLGRKRTTTYARSAMTLAESSPGYSVTNPSHIPATKHEAPPAPGILALYNRGDRRRWYWPCTHCEEYYEPSFELLQWVNSKDVMECGESAKMMCPHCGALNEHDLKHEMNVAGSYVKDGQTITKGGIIVGDGVNSDIASFWPKGVTAAFSSWSTLVVNYLKAEQEFERTGDQQALKTTVNTDQGEPYITRGVGGVRLPEDLKARAEDFGHDEPTVPEGVRFLIATIDVQKNHWVVQVQGVTAPHKEDAMSDSVVIDRFDIRKSKRFDEDGDRVWVSPGTYLEDWDLITEKVLNKTYLLGDDSGRYMAVKITACDSGGRKGVTSMAYQYWLRLKKQGMAGRFLLVKGQPRPSAPRVEVTYPDNAIKGLKPSQTGQIPVLMINSNKVKDHLDNLLDRTEAGGMVRFSDLLDDYFYSELTVEQRGDNDKWENPKKLRNESWDLLHYFFAVCFHLRVEYLNWNSPPGWAKEWDDNVLVFEEKDENSLASKKKVDYSTVKNLGSILG